MNRNSQTARLPYVPPYDWDATLAYFRNHQVPFVETVDTSFYERVVPTSLGIGWFRVHQVPDAHALLLTLHNGAERDLAAIALRVRDMFDLDADPAVLEHTMRKDKELHLFWHHNLGLRIARSWDTTEALFGTVLGQLVSIRFGRVLLEELMKAAGREVLHPRTGAPIVLFPTASELLAADLAGIRTSQARRQTIQLLASQIHGSALSMARDQDPRDLRSALRSLPGIGPWTVEYVLLRGFGDNDAFPSTDYVLKKEIKDHARTLNALRPWRGYAAIALWKRFAEAVSSHRQM